MTQELLFGLQVLRLRYVQYHVKLGCKLCQMSLGLIAHVCIDGPTPKGPDSPEQR